MDRPLRHGPPGGDERLCRHLSPEHPLTVFLGAPPAKDVHLELLEIEEADQIAEGAALRHALLRSTEGPPSPHRA